MRQSGGIPIRIAISGYYGCGNTGDEAVLAGILESFRLKAPEANFTVFSANPDSTARLHNVVAAPRMSASAVKRVLRESDLLISGGGSLLQDVTSLRSLVYYLWVVRSALSMRRPVMFYAQGIGPLRSRAGRLLTQNVANRVHAITVRDEGSAALLAQIGVTRPTIEVTADPAFGLTPAPRQRAEQILTESGVDLMAPRVGIAIRPWHKTEVPLDAYVKLAEGIEAKGQIVFLPMQPPGDTALSDSIAIRVPGAIVIRQPLTPAEALAVTSQFDGLIAMRLHALIFGAMAGIPMLALGYDPKVHSLMTRLDRADTVVDLEGFDPMSAASRFDELMSGGRDYRNEVEATGRGYSMRKLNERNVEIALSLLRKESL